MQAVASFVQAPSSNGIAVGLGYFPNPVNVCNMGHVVAAAPIAPLPGNATAISDAVMTSPPDVSSRTVQVLGGALQYVRGYSVSNGRAASVVFLTDRLVHRCESTFFNATQAAQDAFSNEVRVKTYVIGLDGVNAFWLDEIALAGSGSAQHYFPVQSDVLGQILTALTTIRTTPTCDYGLPASPQFDPLNLNVQITVRAAPMLLDYVGNAGMCGANSGWYYDIPTMPTKVTLCPQACNPVRTTPNSRVQLIFGCSRVGCSSD